MKTQKVLFFILMFIGTYHNAFCQGIFKQRVFVLDEDRILDDENLDFFIEKLNSGEFTTLKSTKEIPHFIRKQMRWLNDKNLADFNEPYQDDCSASLELPRRQVTFLAKSNDVFIISYVTGGIATTAYTALIYYSRKRVIDAWVAYSWYDISSVSAILEWIHKERYREYSLHENFLNY